MPYEYRSDIGLIVLLRVRTYWHCHFSGARTGRWTSPDLAAAAVATHRTGLTKWDRAKSPVSHDILDWTPTGGEM